jgi:aminoglycoside phosphotransferase (APT) family kinase protein
MDLRDANYLCRGGQLRGLIDWSNALIANPLLELARVAEYGNLSTDFAAGYGITARERAALDQRLGLCCRLYTAAMLAVVFLSEMPDPDVARLKVDRVRELLAGLGDPSTES